jgi:DNA polymerase III alpha subunit
MYIPLHGHSTFSFLESVGKPKDIIKKAKEL